MKKRVLTTGVVTLVAMATVVSFAVAVSGSLTPSPADAPTDWPKNALGVTYGSGLDALSPEDEPDLIRVEATNGKIGYACRSDLEGPQPDSPAAAVAQQKANEGKPDLVPVYEVDGVTQVGVFVAREN